MRAINDSMPGALIVVAQVVVVVVTAPFLVGLMRLVRSRLEGREGPPVRQPLRDLRKLLGKEAIRSEYTSWVFASAPVVVFATSLVVAAIAPILGLRTPLTPTSDLLVVVSLLLLGTVSLTLAGLDTGTPFGGMGASRGITIAALAEPTILVAAFALSIPAGSSNLSAILSARLAAPHTATSPQSLLAFVAFVVVSMAETGRLPVDNPSTHLELTMIHEAMVLEYAGPDLALVELGSWIRLVLFLGLTANLFVPWGIASVTSVRWLALACVAFIAKVALLGVVLAIGEVFLAKLRLFRVPELLSFSFVFAVLAVMASFFLR